MKAQKYIAYNEEGRYMYSRFDSFDSIAEAVRSAAEFYTYKYDDGRRIAAATFIDVTGVDDYIRRYKITNPDTRRLRWRKV